MDGEPFEFFVLKKDILITIVLLFNNSTIVIRM
jgi:hypothetical protein